MIINVNRAKLDTIAEAHGVKVDGGRQGTGSFWDLYIGVGAPRSTLDALMMDLKGHEIGCRMTINAYDSPEHPDYGKPFLVVHSFWNE